MKRTLLLLLFGLLVSLLNYTAWGQKVIITELGNRLIVTLKSGSKDAIQGIIIPNKRIEKIFLNRVSIDKRIEYKKILDETKTVEEMKKVIFDGFNRSIQRGNELKINWKNIKFTKIEYDTAHILSDKMYECKLHFSEGTNNYIVRFDCMGTENDIAIIWLYTPVQIIPIPYVDKCLKYKELYMKSCLEMMERPGILRDTKPPNITTKDYCECSFYEIAKSVNCESILINSKKNLQMRGGSDCSK